MKNIKFLIFVLLIVGLSANSFAGDKIGIRAGWQYSNIYAGSSIGDNMSSLYLGVFKEKAIIPLIKIGSGLEYGQIGTNWDSKNSLKLHQLSVPVYAKLKLGPVYAIAGAAASFKVAESWDIESSSEAMKENFDANSFDVPVFGGIGFKILMLSIEARYYMGTIGVSGNMPSDEYKSQYLQIGLALSI